MKIRVDARPTLDECSCQSCKDLAALYSSVLQNVSLLAETGFGEGEICHTLMRGAREEKQTVAVSAAILVR
jgi:hypothetical protein